MSQTLHDLWKEYEFGSHGCKTAKDWTATERGRDKFKYYWQNVVWKKICELVCRGCTAERARDKIYSVYGYSSMVTAIIEQLVKDKGRHPELRVGHLFVVKLLDCFISYLGLVKLLALDH